MLVVAGGGVSLKPTAQRGVRMAVFVCRCSWVHVGMGVNVVRRGCKS